MDSQTYVHDQFMKIQVKSDKMNCSNECQWNQLNIIKYMILNGTE